jgi:hypothetical protein
MTEATPTFPSPFGPIADRTATSFPTLELTERVVLLIDVSRSMSQGDYPPTRLRAAKQAALAFIDRKLGIDESDQVAVVAFAGRARVLTKLQRVDLGRAGVEKSVARLKISYSGTQMGHGLRKAASLLDIPLGIKGDPKKGMAIAQKKGMASFVRRIVVLSDGENMGGPNPIETAERLKQSGVVIDCIGIGERGEGARRGEGLDELMLRSVASPGRYKYIRDTSTLLYHFESLADKVTEEWDSMSVDTDLKSPGAANAKGMAGNEPMARKRPLWRRALVGVRTVFVQLAFALVPSVILGVFVLPYAMDLEMAPDDLEAWAAPWAATAGMGFVGAWAVRLGSFGIRSFSGVLAALVGVGVGYGLGAYVLAESASVAQEWVTDDPLPHAIALGAGALVVVLGSVATPIQLVTGVTRVPRPWALLDRRRYGFFVIKEGSPYMGHQCLNEKDEWTVFTIGDKVVVCPVCGQAHHADCWIWNGGHCYGGDTPCPGERPVPRAY